MSKELTELCTTLVQNRQRRLNGNKLVAFAVLLAFLSSCSVLKPKAPVQRPVPVEKPVEPEIPKEEVKPVEAKVNSVVLVLPFQLDKIQGVEPSRVDVKRSELPLDFYQGFKLAMENLAKQGHNFKLTVLDSRDNESENSKLAVSSDVQSADLVVGPVFPKEITAFSRAGKLTYGLQVSPLAASRPSQFNIPNLVSLVTPIGYHSKGLADYLVSQIKSGDKLIIVNKQDDDSFSFLTPLKQSLQEKKVDFVEIKNTDEIEDQVNITGRNFVVVGTTNKFSVNTILNDLIEVQNGLGAKVELFGHPSWAKASYNSSSLQILKAKITATTYVNSNKSNVRDFQKKYREQFKVEPSEYAYKGYDTGYFFGYMLGKFGPDYPKHLVGEEYNGLQTNYRFEKNAQWGYVNTYIRILQFDGYHYVPVN